MLTIKITLHEILTGIQDWINKAIKSDIDIFDTNYTEFYIYPKKVDLYIKEKVGKKTIYKKVDHFFTTDNYNPGLSVTLTDNTTIDDKLELDCNLSIEQDYHNYRVYDAKKPPLEGGDYIECESREQAAKLYKLLGKVTDKKSWSWG